jgi:uncharacterized delta-60 repeat protein
MRFLIPVLLTMMLGIAYAAPGDLDTTFGTNGVATYDSGNVDHGWTVLLQPDGKIVVPGVTFNGTDGDVLVLRYNSDGTLDTTFGTNGVATYDSGNVDHAWWTAILQPDGKIVVPGVTFNGTDDDVLVLRYNSDGTLDTTFGTNGVATYDSGNVDEGRTAILQPDGKIVVPGVTFNGTDYDLLVVRLIGDAGGSGGSGGGSGGGGCSMSNPEGQINIAHQLILVGIFALGLLVWRERRRRLSTYGR